LQNLSFKRMQVRNAIRKLFLVGWQKRGNNAFKTKFWGWGERGNLASKPGKARDLTVHGPLRRNGWGKKQCLTGKTRQDPEEKEKEHPVQ